MKHELVISEHGALTAAQVTAQKNLIQQVMAAVMKKDVHYGIIPGCKKPSLYKAGSECILATFRIAVEPITEDLSTHDCFRYRVTAKGFLPDGTVVGMGIGECSTDEEKYKWRGAVNDREFDATPVDQRRVKFSRPSQYNQAGETKQVRTNPADLANTALKMAKKRAQIDLTLTATSASDVFDQDLEDLPAEYVDDRIAKPSGKPIVSEPTATTTAAQDAPASTEGITEGQAKMVYAKIMTAGHKVEDVLMALNIKELKDIKKADLTKTVRMIESGECFGEAA